MGLSERGNEEVQWVTWQSAEHHWVWRWSWLVLLPDEIDGLSLCLELWVSAYDLSALQPGPGHRVLEVGASKSPFLRRGQG